MISRRLFLAGAAAVAAPAIIRPGILMPVKRILMPEVRGSGVVTLATLRELLLPGLLAVTGSYRDIPVQFLTLAEPGDAIAGVVVNRDVECPLFCGDVVTLK